MAVRRSWRIATARRNPTIADKGLAMGDGCRAFRCRGPIFAARSIREPGNREAGYAEAERVQSVAACGATNSLGKRIALGRKLALVQGLEQLPCSWASLFQYPRVRAWRRARISRNTKGRRAIAVFFAAMLTVIH